MRLAFDVGAEWDHLSAQMCWRRMARYRLGMGVLRWWDSFWYSAGQTLQDIHPILAISIVLRRLRWVTPRVNVRTTSGVGGTLLLCAFIAVGIRMWGTENGSARAGVMLQTVPSDATIVQQASGSGPGPDFDRLSPGKGAAWREPAPQLDEATRRRVALTRA